MYSLFLYTWVFSAAVLVVICWMERNNAEGTYKITRAALTALLFLPAMLLLPEWHILPANTQLHPIIEVARQSSPLWLKLLWGVGVVFCLIKIAASFWQLRRWRIASSAVTDAELLAQAKTCCQRIGHMGELEIRQLQGDGGPAASGYFRATIYLPHHWQQWTGTTRDAVLLHEISHHLNRDPFWKLLSLCARSLHWFNPCVAWLTQKWDDHSEYHCDARVIKSGFRKETYAHILCDLASSAPYSAMAMAAPSSLEKRIRKLSTNVQTHHHLWIYALSTALILTALALAVLRPARDPGTPLSPTPEDTDLRLQANPFPADAP
jgi:beta-lactamase regulating signal transducer with metallopeptidase domain